MKFKLFNTEIYISFLFAAVVVLMLATDRTGLVIPTMFAVFIHESGHLLAMWATDCAPKSIRLIPASVQIVRSFPTKAGSEAAILICGPAANITVFVTLFLNHLALENSNSLIFGMLNLIIALFNLLPVNGLDGGSLLKLILLKYVDTHRANLVVRVVTVIVAALIFSTGVVLAIRGSLNLSVFIVAIYLFISCMLKI